VRATSPIAANALGALLSLVATPATVAGIVALNRIGGAPEEARGPREVAFEVERRREKAPPPEPQPLRAERRRAPASERAALPKLPEVAGADLAGVDLDLPELRLEGLGPVSEKVLGDLERVVHTEATVDRRPAPLVKTPIEAPEDARRRNIAGRVVVNLLIGTDGSVRAVKVLEAEPPGVFERAVIDAVRGWVFEPAVYRGETVEMWATLPVRFTP
jgi:protein TonB